MRRIIVIFLLINAVCLYAQNSKMSPYVRQAMVAYKDMPAASKAKGLYTAPANRIPTITAFVRTEDTDALRQQGCRIYAQWDDIVIASIPLDKLSTLASMPQIQRIEAGQSCSVTNDTTAAITKARDVWKMTLPSTLTSTGSAQANPSTITGNGVVVGVMDIGFDLTHPTFYSKDGQTYRIKQLWDQIDQTEGGDPVIGEDTIYVGRQYIGEESLLSLQHSYDGLTQTHGTHTAGTAAGSGWDGSFNPQPSTPNTYSGMAPDADICLVCNAADNADLIPEEDWYKYTTATDMLGFKYIFDYADKVGKPCVINFSEGAHDDLYESGLYSEVLSKMLGPGHIICASAGNEGGGDGTYMHKAVGENKKGAFLAKWSLNTARYTLRSKEPAEILLSFYKNRVKCIEKSYIAEPTESTVTDTIYIKGDTLLFYRDTYPSCYDKNLYATDICFKDVSNDKYGYAIPTSLTLLGEENDIEVFSCGGYFVRNSLDSSLDNYDNTHNILFPSSAEDVVCVGNCAYRTEFKNYEGVWQSPYTTEDKDGVISRYSSVGPALSGLTKPDVVAPGMNIISSYNSFFREQTEYNQKYDVSHFTWNNRQYQWNAQSGTSMSSPVVTGIIALWLQVCPTLTPDQVKDVFAHTATHYDSSLNYPNDQYGWGQVDALAGLEYVKNVYCGIERLESEDSKEKTERFYTLDGIQRSNDNIKGVFIIKNSHGTRKSIK